MAFCSFSKDCSETLFTSVENQFITKYLPVADGDAVRAYLYGLYLCERREDFDAASAATLLRIPKEKFFAIFTFWEECGLVQILSREPLFVEYLPVNSAVGKPKPIRPEKYAAFNRELYKQLQKAGKDFKPYEMQRILEFLENNPMQPQAFLLISEYCAKKDGDKLSCAHILNKAAKLVKEHKYTYEQVEAELNDFHEHEREMSKIFSLLSIYKKPREEDYDYLTRWTGWGMEVKAVYACAAKLKKGSLATLDALLSELHEKDVHTETDAVEYLERREEIVSAVFAVARKLGVRIQNPRPYAEEYGEKWLERGYDSESLTQLAALAMKLGYGFSELDGMLDKLYGEGIVDGAGVKEYCAAREKELKLLQSIQSVCGVIKKTQAALDMINSWRGWNFSDAMILEAAKRSAGASAPLPYMNKLLSEWKRAGAFTPTAIPEKVAPAPVQQERTLAADRKSAREHHYAVLRQQAEARAEQAKNAALRDEQFKEADAAIKRGEIALAKAEVFTPEKLPALREALNAERAKRSAALKRLNLTEADLLPRYSCAKCSDTGFLPNGAPCDCFKG